MRELITYFSEQTTIPLDVEIANSILIAKEEFSVVRLEWIHIDRGLCYVYIRHYDTLESVKTKIKQRKIM